MPSELENLLILKAEQYKFIIRSKVPKNSNANNYLYEIIYRGYDGKLYYVTFDKSTYKNIE